MQLSRNQFIVLRALEVQGRLSSADLLTATAKAISSSSMYDAVSDLEAGGFVKVTYDTAPKRPVRYIEITAEGKEAVRVEQRAYDSVGAR